MEVLVFMDKGVAQNLLPDADEVLVVLHIGRVYIGFNDATQDFNSFGGTDVDTFTEVLKYKQI